MSKPRFESFLRCHDSALNLGTGFEGRALSAAKPERLKTRSLKFKIEAPNPLLSFFTCRLNESLLRQAGDLHEPRLPNLGAIDRVEKQSLRLLVGP